MCSRQMPPTLLPAIPRSRCESLFTQHQPSLRSSARCPQMAPMLLLAPPTMPTTALRELIPAPRLRCGPSSRIAHFLSISSRCFRTLERFAFTRYLQITSKLCKSHPNFATFRSHVTPTFISATLRHRSVSRSCNRIQTLQLFSPLPSNRTVGAPHSHLRPHRHCGNATLSPADGHIISSLVEASPQAAPTTDASVHSSEGRFGPSCSSVNLVTRHANTPHYAQC